MVRKIIASRLYQRCVDCLSLTFSKRSKRDQLGSLTTVRITNVKSFDLPGLLHVFLALIHMLVPRMKSLLIERIHTWSSEFTFSSGSGWDDEKCSTPGPVKIGHKKDGRLWQPHRFMLLGLPYLAAGSAIFF